MPHMPSGSHIVLISTGLTAMSTITPNYLLYVSTKGAIEQMVRVLSKDLARKGIVVNAIAPGPTATDLFLEGKSEQVLKAIAGMSPFGRIGKPEEIAEGHITWKSMKLLLSGLGGDHPIFFVVAIYSALIAQCLFHAGQPWFLGIWGAQYETHHPSEVSLPL